MKQEIQRQIQALLDQAQKTATTGSHSQSFTLDDLKIFIDLMFKMVQQIEQIKSAENVLFFLGGTGSGKSATIDYLRGCQFGLIKTPKGYVYRVIESDSCTDIAEIGDGTFQSKTLYPSVYSALSNNITYCDLPGFYDTRGLAQQLVASVGIDLVIKGVRSIQGFAVLISYDMITGTKGEKFDYFMDNLIQTVGKIDTIKDSLVFIFTKIDPRILKDFEHDEILLKFETDLQEFISSKEELLKQKTSCDLVIRDSFSINDILKSYPDSNQFVYVLTKQDFQFVDLVTKLRTILINKPTENLRHLMTHFSNGERYSELSEEDLNYITFHSGHSHCSSQIANEKSIFKREKQLLNYVISRKTDRLLYVDLDTAQKSEKIIAGINSLKKYDDRNNFRTFLQGLSESIFRIIVDNTAQQGIVICRDRYELLGKFSKAKELIATYESESNNYFYCLEYLENLIKYDQISESPSNLACFPSENEYDHLRDITENINKKRAATYTLSIEIKTLENRLNALKNNDEIIDYPVPKICEIADITYTEVGIIGMNAYVVTGAVTLGIVALIPLALPTVVAVSAVEVVGIAIGGMFGQVIYEQVREGRSWFATSGWVPTISENGVTDEQTALEQAVDTRVTCGFLYNSSYNGQKFPYSYNSAKSYAKSKTDPLNLIISNDASTTNQGLFKAHYVCYKNMECSSAVWLAMKYRDQPKIREEMSGLEEQINERLTNLNTLENKIVELQQQRKEIVTPIIQQLEKLLLEKLKEIGDEDQNIIGVQKRISQNNAIYTENQDLFEIVAVTQHLLNDDEVFLKTIPEFMEYYEQAKNIKQTQIDNALLPHMTRLENAFDTHNFQWVNFLLDHYLNYVVTFKTILNENILHLMVRNSTYRLTSIRYQNLRKENFDFVQPDKNGEIPIIAALRQGNIDLAMVIAEIVDILEINKIEEMILVSIRENAPLDFFHRVLQRKSELCKNPGHRETSCDEKMPYSLGNSVDSTQKSKGNLLHLLVERNFVEHVKKSLEFAEYQDYLYKLDSEHRTPLALAAFENHFEIVKLILRQNKFTLDTTVAKNGMHVAPPIFWAILGRHNAMACLLLREIRNYHQQEGYYRKTMKITLPYKQVVEEKSPSQYAQEIDPALARTLASCNSPNFPENQHPQNLVFQGGGPRAVAFIGALKRLRDYKFSMSKVRRVAGTSAGAIMAAFLATGHTIDDIENILKNTPFINLIADDVLKNIDLDILANLLQKAIEIYYDPVEKTTEHLLSAFKFVLRQDGLCDGNALLNLIESNIFAKTKIKSLTFGELAQKVERETSNL